MIDGTEPTPGFQGNDRSGEERLLAEFTRRMDEALARRLPDRRLDEKLAEIKGRAVTPVSTETTPEPSDNVADAEQTEDLDGAWATAAGIIATANEVRDDIVGSAETEANKIRNDAREKAEQLLEAAILEAEEIRTAARKESARLLTTAKRKAGAASENRDAEIDQSPEHRDERSEDRHDVPLTRLREGDVAHPRIPRPNRPGDERIIPTQRATERTEADR
jgi:cell division septum initiation protein DivIVA